MKYSPANAELKYRVLLGGRDEIRGDLYIWRIPGKKPDLACRKIALEGEANEEMDPACSFWGYEISPQAFELAKSRVNERLHFKLADIRQEDGSFDLILIVDMLEHLENCFSFLRDLKSKSEYKIISFVLDLSVESLLRPNALLGFRSTRGHVGHVHYFTKDMALAMLEDLGYEVLDYFYTPRAISLADTLKKKILKLPRVLFFSIRKDLAVRVLGGYGLLVLAK